jgi:Amt family ammonium transporter
LEKLRTGHATTLGAASGAVAGLVAITPACGYVNAMGSILIGAAGGAISLYMCSIVKIKRGYDDALDVVGVHGAAGLVGTLLIGIFATKHANPGIAYDGLVDSGSFHLLGMQALATVVTIAWAFTVTWIIATLIQRTIGFRVPEPVEIEGLDTVLHAESAYDFGTTGSLRL